MTRPARCLVSQASAYARALEQWTAMQQWLSRELIRKHPDVHCIFAVRELRNQAERRVLWIERGRRR